MSRQKNRDTGPEMALRRELHRRGLRYRVNYRIPELGRTRPDIAFTKQKVAVFVDGCFWHRCPDHATFPRANAEWWERKLGRNVSRDRMIDASLDRLGWRTIRIWEHEYASAAADLVEKYVRSDSRE